jgi:ubiquinone/menaquinone biosynthesis C-methylase UbiE
MTEYQMAEQDTFQLQGNAPQNYEEQSVPAIFRTLAELTLRQVEVPAGARVIDVACGTGIVARLVAKKSARLDRW